MFLYYLYFFIFYISIHVIFGALWPVSLTRLNTMSPVLCSFRMRVHTIIMLMFPPPVTRLRATQSQLDKWDPRNDAVEAAHHSDEGKMEGKALAACPNVCLHRAAFAVGTRAPPVDIQQSFVQAAWFGIVGHLEAWEPLINVRRVKKIKINTSQILLMSHSSVQASTSGRSMLLIKQRSDSF